MKTTSLPSVEEKTLDFLSDVSTDVDLSPEQPTAITSWFRDYMTQDRNQAYTRLVEGIEEEKSMIADASYITDGMRREAHAKDQALTYILENVVKPLYGKE